MSVREHEWAEIRRLYVAAFNLCLKGAKASHEEMCAPEARRFLAHPIYGGVAVEITWHGRIEHEQLMEGSGDAIHSREHGTLAATAGDAGPAFGAALREGLEQAADMDATATLIYGERGTPEREAFEKRLAEYRDLDLGQLVAILKSRTGGAKELEGAE